MRRFFKSLLRQPRHPPDIHDPQIDELLEELGMEEYAAVFARERLLIDDLPDLDDDFLERLVPKSRPRNRLKSWINKTYPNVPKVIADCEVDQNELKLNEEHSCSLDRGVLGTLRDRPVVVLKVHVDCSNTADLIVAEVHRLMTIQSPFVMEVLGYCFIDRKRSALLVFERFEEISLSCLRKGHQDDVPPLQRLHYLHQMASAFSAVNSSGCVWSQTLENIFISHEQGILKLFTGGQIIANRDLGHCLHGTPYYVSPEALRGDQGDTRDRELSEVYAWAIASWQLWTGKDPFPAISRRCRSSPLKALFEIHGMGGDGDAITRPDLFDPDILNCPELVRDLIADCWAFEPCDRPSFQEIVVALDVEIEKQM